MPPAVPLAVLDQLRSFDTPTVCNVLELFDAMPRTASSPIRKKTPSVRSEGHGVDRRRIASTAATAATEMKNVAPGYPRITGGCHSARR